MPVTHAELFAGIGGFSLAARWMGWTTVFQVEIDEWCKERLKRNFKNTKIYGDIKKFKASKFKGKIDVLSGGFPCQPFTVSGKLEGTSDDRYLWPEMFRVFKEIRPRFIEVENVPGLVNMALDKVLDDLEGEGYTCWPPTIIPACAVGADHLRERVWIVAHTSSIRCETIFYGNKKSSDKKKRTSHACNSRVITAEQFEKSYNQSLLLGSKDGFPTWVDFPRGIKAAGNAIVPQVAFEIFNHISLFLN